MLPPHNKTKKSGAGNRGFSGAASMMTLPELAAVSLEEFLRAFMRSRFGPQTPLTEIVPASARLALECIGNSDALYHNIEHTMLVTLAATIAKPIKLI